MHGTVPLATLAAVTVFAALTSMGVTGESVLAAAILIATSIVAFDAGVQFQELRSDRNDDASDNVNTRWSE